VQQQKQVQISVGHKQEASKVQFFISFVQLKFQYRKTDSALKKKDSVGHLKDLDEPLLPKLIIYPLQQNILNSK
jgi:hypothetical protein